MLVSHDLLPNSSLCNLWHVCQHDLLAKSNLQHLRCWFVPLYKCTTEHDLASGLLVPRVPEIYLPLKQCIEILGAGLKPRSAQAILDHCLQGLAQKVTQHPLVHASLQITDI